MNNTRMLLGRLTMPVFIALRPETSDNREGYATVTQEKLLDLPIINGSIRQYAIDTEVGIKLLGMKPIAVMIETDWYVILHDEPCFATWNEPRILPKQLQWLTKLLHA